MFNEITPQINQVETNPFNQQIESKKNMIKNNVQIEAWAPFGEGKNNVFQNSILLLIAGKYQKSVAQVILRWLVQRDIVALAKSTSIERMKENFEIFDFKLSSDDMNVIRTLDTENSLFFNHQAPETVDMFVNMIENRREK